MRRSIRCPSTTAWWTSALALIGAISGAKTAAQDAPLPADVHVEWDTSKAYRETTITRERICINGLWRWQPAASKADQVPADGWGYFKVPGCWPGITDYMQKDAQTVHLHPSWKNTNLREVSAAWYQREITIPTAWKGRRITLSAEYVNSYAAVYVDGQKAGEILFPAGELDITSHCRPGGAQVLAMIVVALPLKGVMQSYANSATAREVTGSVERRGLCGDVCLVSTPAGPRLGTGRVETSVRKWEIAVHASLEGLQAGERYALAARVTDGDREIKSFQGAPFDRRQLQEGRITFSAPWQPEKLWDVHTPQNRYELQVSLLNAEGKVLDILPAVRFGFREFWIDGRDFYLNGTRVHLSAVPLDNAQVSAATATYAATRESLARLRTLGINFVYTHNYDCEPGAHLSFAEILRAADDEGVLVALTQPHFGQYDWDAREAAEKNSYARHAAFYVQVAANHPSVVMYSTSHNGTGYNEDMNPDLIDGLHDRRDSWSLNNSKKALRAEAIIQRLDPTRMVYHHASGNLGILHAINFYPNFVPVQELCDWFEHWATQGVKPVFLCEYGAPFSWDWAMYRGWYRDKREFGSAVVPWEFCLAEWNAQFFGDRAFDLSKMEKENLRWEAQQFRAGRTWHRWDYPHQLGSTDFPEREPVFARYYAENWRAFRTWGVSATSPWEHNMLFKLGPGLDRNRRENFKIDWPNLQRPGFSPDYQEERFERMDMAYQRTDWIATAGAEALIRNNQPLLAYIGGKPDAFTSKDHNFIAGESLDKQLVVLNQSRSRVDCTCTWSLALPEPIHGQQSVTIEPGDQSRIPVRCALPVNARPGEYKLTAEFIFSTGEKQNDEFIAHILRPVTVAHPAARIALFDPQGETGALLKSNGIRFDRVDANAGLGSFDLLIIGKAALTAEGPAPEVSRVRDGLRVIVFEQKADVLEKRFGFRVEEYGLRNVFPRIPDHPVLAGLQTEHLRDWRGAATILPSRLTYELNPKFNGAPTVNWCALPVTRLWRCGCRGNVASVLIEKPARGDFQPLVDGGFSLQYSPLMLYREGQGLMLFCQMDVTGRTEPDPAAQLLVSNILNYVEHWKPSARREMLYAGEKAGQAHLVAAGFKVHAYSGDALKPDQMLIVGPGGAKTFAEKKDAIAAFLQAGGHLLALGFTQEDANTCLPFAVSMNPAEHISTYFPPPGADGLLAGVGPADVHNRDPRKLQLLSSGVHIVGDGVLAVATDANVVLCQLIPWQFEPGRNFGLKRTFRRSSFLVTRLASNLGAESEVPLLQRFSTPAGKEEPGRWLQGFYMDKPEEWDDPYRFFRW